MEAKKIINSVDKVMDPIGVLLIVCAYFLNKYSIIKLTLDEVLLISIGAGSVRSIWESRKRKIAAKLEEEEQEEKSEEMVDDEK